MQFNRKTIGTIFFILKTTSLYFMEDRSAEILYRKLQRVYQLRCIKTRVRSLKKKTKSAPAKLSLITRTMGNDSANLDANCKVYRKSDVSYATDARLSFR